MKLTPVIELLRQRIGLEPESLGPTALARVVKARMRALGLTETALYTARLARDEGEFRGLVEDLAVPETWFFRGGEVFGYLARQAADTLRMRGPGAKFRVLSVPCSTGEEPYSVAIALAEAGIPAEACEIEGVDLSTRHLDRARQGLYTDFSFRQTAPDLRRHHFRLVDGSWELNPALRARVRFRQGNLLDPLFLMGEAPFEVIFCRNLFIYLHTDARLRALDTLARLLAPEGYLCMGHAEPLELLDRRFVRDPRGDLFVYRRAPAQPAPQLPAPAARQSRPRTTVPAPKIAPRSVRSPQRETTVPQFSGDDLLARARQQADAGRMNEARAACEDQLARCGPSADLYSLLGVLHQARGERDEAVRDFQRALYLEPRHVEALTHLVLLLREQGEHTQADRLRKRLDRAASEGSK